MAAASLTASPSLRLVTPDEYLDREEKAETKSEYIAGEILAMSGAKPSHNFITTDTMRLLGNLLQAAGGSCDIINNDQKVRATQAGPFFYPDITVVCGEPVFDDRDCLRNPYLIVEVSFESTEEFDRGEKFRNYRQFESLQHYVLIAQDRVHVEHFARLERIVWERVGEYSDRADLLALPSLGVAVPLTEIYRRIPDAP